MADLRSNFVGIKSPNPFWLASAPPTDKEYNVRRAYEAGWGGVVWKTLGMEGPPVVNVNGPRYGVIYGADRRVLGLNNIELITDRPLEVNLREIKSVKRDYPDRALIISLMVPCEEEAWKSILAAIEDTGADGVELNFGCPHGMSERGMGAAVGQVPDYVEMVTRWVKQHSRMPCIVKLTPNSFALARTVEYFRIPRNVLTICLGKSTYARCGIIVNVTPLEPEWEGHVTLEFSNTTPLPAKIYANEGVAQMLFLESDEECETSYKDRGGKYQGQRGVTLPKA